MKTASLEEERGFGSSKQYHEIIRLLTEKTGSAVIGATDMAEEKSRSIGRSLCFTAAHSLRNPVTIMRSCIKRLQEKETVAEENLREGFDMLFVISNRLSSLVNSILEVGKSESTSMVSVHQKEAGVLYLMENREELEKSLCLTAAHEFRNSIQAMQLYLEILKGQEGEIPQESRQKGLKQLSVITDHLSSLIDDLLEIGKSESGGIQMHWERTTIHEVISSAREILKGTIDNNNISINLSLHTENPDICVDKRRLIRVFINLISNAVKYSSISGNIDISVNDLRGKLEISIRDYGRGITPGEEEKIFEMFVQGSASKKGTGLGLTICRTIIAAHGGKISATNHTDGGAVFQFILPRFPLVLTE